MQQLSCPPRIDRGSLRGIYNADTTKRAANVSGGADSRMPSSAWDSHLHIMDPARYLPVEDIPYKPATATHGYDLTLMLDSMRAVGNERALGLPLFDPNTTAHEHIRRWDSEGVRVVRVNLVTYGDGTPINELKSQINKYVDLIKPVDCVLQLYTKMERIIELEDFSPTLGVRMVFDHYSDLSLPKSSDPISGAYRLSHVDSDIGEDLDPVTLELFEQAPRLPNLDPSAIEDVAAGVVLSELGDSKAARMAMNHVGYPSATFLYPVNRACSSSPQTILSIAFHPRTGIISVGIGAGMERSGCLAVKSHLKAAEVRSSGHLCDEIVPVLQIFFDGLGHIVVDTDDGIHPQANLERLAKLKPVFKENGISTAGNSSQVSDGGAATLLMRRSTAEELGLGRSIMDKFVSAVTVGCLSDEMGVVPAIAIPKLLHSVGLTNNDIHRWETNNDFANQSIYCLRKLELEKAYEDNKANQNGGAIALGHLLGANGARLTSTLLHGLGRPDGGELGIVSMCAGPGMGMAGLLYENEGDRNTRLFGMKRTSPLSSNLFKFSRHECPTGLTHIRELHGIRGKVRNNI
ncbi:acetyl acetyltransferase [Fusarium beomiforme]|uniref:acetyl-CoA C-acyltransferase n=1 Tax=Fusarium beomiforme TaxID=44412 RepID=A0A9P5AGP2_9HYPO|nr:acetyl acetyltransferase [Fusarium beomiforme]